MDVAQNTSCLICNRIADIRAGISAYIVAESDTGYAVIGDHQFYRGYTLFLSKTHASELHELEPAVRRQFLEDMSDVAAAVFRAFRPRKLNYELLGNKDIHLHWHLFPRHADDPIPEMPIWCNSKDVRESDATRPNPETLITLRRALMDKLQKYPRFRSRI